MLRKFSALFAALALLTACAAPPSAPVPPVAPAPAPTNVSDCRACHAGQGTQPGAANVYQHWEKSGHGRFLNRPANRPDCDACHDLSGAAGHLDGKVNAPGANIFHLVQGYLNPDPGQEWDIQVSFDQQCWISCHKAAGIRDMRHTQDDDPAPGAVQMGQHLSFTKPVGDIPLDEDIARTRRDFSGPPYFITCVGCHDPHGTGITSMTKGSNRMVRENYRSPARLCGRCHA